MAFGLSAGAIGLIGAGASVVGGIMASDAAGDAADAQSQSARESTAAQAAIADKQIAFQREQLDRATAMQEPFRQAGLAGQNRLLELLGIGGNGGAAGYGSAMRDFGMADFQQDPGYQFRMDEGQKALERGAAARGGLLSGRAAKDTMRFAQGLGAQEFGAAFDRFNVNRANKLQPLQSLAGVGQSSTNALGQAGQNFASGAGSALGAYGAAQGANILGAGNARASGYVGKANSWSDAIGQGVGAFQQNQLMGMLRQPSYSTPDYGMGPMQGGSGGLDSSFDQYLAR